jgi:hypothetical protein
MVSPSQVGRLVALLVAAGCSANNSGEPGHSGSAQASGSSTSGSGTQSESGSVASGSASASGVNGGSGSGGVGSGAPGTTGSSGVTSGAMSGGGSGAATTGASSGDGASGSSGQASTGAESGATAGGAEGGTSGAGPFTCTLVVGLFTTSQWFSGMMPGGASKTFLMDGVDATKWEGKQTKYAYIEKWEDPTNAVWSLALTNPCATNSATPDRVVFVGFSPAIPADQDYAMYSKLSTNQMDWETLLNGVIATIKMKYPSAKEIDILTMGRAPNNMLCSNNNDVDTIIQPYEDAAYEAVAAASGGFVVVGPKYYVPDCNTSYIFANDSDYTTTAANAIATQVAAYYVAHP